MTGFQLQSDFEPQGDQPQAIQELTEGLLQGRRRQTLLGVTGSGKTFAMANVLAAINRPTLVISHNKTLAAQLYSELREFFPQNAVEYFVSYYDYYQPEAYIPQTDIYIEKDASINDELDRLRLRATSSLMARRDVVIVASVSCIYGLGSPEDYVDMLVMIEPGQAVGRDQVLKQLVDIQYDRNDVDFRRGTFRVRGDVVEVFPAYEERAIRVEFFGDEVERVREIDPLTGDIIQDRARVAIYPAKHFVTSQERINQSVNTIRQELRSRLAELETQGKLLEAQRLESRTHYDLEMLQEVGYCHGIENYSRHISGRPPGSKPYCLLDYFPDEFLTFIDESHVTVPQVRGMYFGDRSRKDTLVEYGFRLPSALDNRPLRFEEFEGLIGDVIYVSATPGEFELEQSQGRVVEQVIRPTGLLDPQVTVLPTKGQVDELIQRIRERADRQERTLATTLTKRLAEDLTQYLQDVGLRVKYLHSDIPAIERVEILRDLRVGDFDCLVGINLLREGLDLPEVSLVAVLDADKTGFLRSETALIQVAGRAARHVQGEVILFADRMTDAMEGAIHEMERRRDKQLLYNEKHNITPRSIEKAVRQGIEVLSKAREEVAAAIGESPEGYDLAATIAELEWEMAAAARSLQFEQAAKIRDRIVALRKHELPASTTRGAS